jgi:hypothetical protein
MRKLTKCCRTCKFAPDWLRTPTGRIKQFGYCLLRHIEVRAKDARDCCGWQPLDPQQPAARGEVGR